MPRPSLSSFLRLMDVRTIASPIKQSPTPSPLTMAGPAQDKGRPDTSGHKRPSVKKNREGCFMALRIFWSKPDPSHPQLTVRARRKNVRLSEWIQIQWIITPSWEESLFMEFPAVERKPSQLCVYFQKLTEYCVSWEKELGVKRLVAWPGRESSETL